MAKFPAHNKGCYTNQTSRCAKTVKLRGSNSETAQCMRSAVSGSNFCKPHKPFCDCEHDENAHEALKPYECSKCSCTGPEA